MYFGRRSTFGEHLACRPLDIDRLVHANRLDLNLDPIKNSVTSIPVEVDIWLQDQSVVQDGLWVIAIGAHVSA